MSEVPEGLVAASAAAAAAAAVAVGGGGGGGGAGRGQHHHRPGGQPRGQREKTREARTARRPRQVLGTRVVEAAHHHRRRVGRRLHDTTKKKGNDKETKNISNQTTAFDRPPLCLLVLLDRTSCKHYRIKIFA